MATTFTVTQTTDNIVIDTMRGKYDDGTIEVDRPPLFEFSCKNTGVTAQILKTGKDITIKRAGRPAFYGIIETPIPAVDSNGQTLTVRGIDKGYRLMQARTCDSYDYDEDGDPATTRDAVTMNPWYYFIFRKAGGALDVNGLEPAVDGVEFETVAACLTGSRFVYQADLQDASFFLASDVTNRTKLLMVYRDSASGDVRPKLQRARLNGKFNTAATGIVTSAQLRSGDRNIDEMGPPQGVIVTIIGEEHAYVTDDPTVVLTSVAGSPTVVTLTPSDLTKISNYNSSGLTAWIGRASFAGGASGHSLTVGISLGAIGGANSDDSSTKLHYVKVEATIAKSLTDTGMEYLTQLIDTVANGETATVKKIGNLTPRSATQSDKFAQPFFVDSSVNVDVNRIVAVLRKVGAPTGTATIRISTTPGSGGVTTTQDVSLLGTVARAIEYSIASTALTANALYYVSIEYTGGDASNYIIWESSSAGPYIVIDPTYYDQIAPKYYDGSDYTAITGHAMSCKVYYLPSSISDNWVESDFQGMNRLESLETLRKLSISNSSNNTSPHYDAFIVPDTLIFGSLRFFVKFRERRGQDVTAKTYSFGEGNLKEISHEFYGTELAFQTIAYGAGSGVAQTRIVSKTAFTSGGLYDSDRDPDGGTRLYGDAPRIMDFKDPNEQSIVALLRKARAFHKLHRDPIETVEVEVRAETIAYFGLGDRIKIAEVTTRTNSLLRVVELERAWSGNEEESVRIRVGEKPEDVVTRISSPGAKVDTLTIRDQPKKISVARTGATVFFDKTTHGCFYFTIDDGSVVERVFLEVTTVPYNVPVSGGGAIAQFKGDAPGADPVYGSKISLAVDPTLGANGLPSAFATDKLPTPFGSQTTSQTLRLDVTNFVAQSGTKLITNGQHRVFFLSDSDTNNANGLGAVGVVVVVEFREGE